MNEIRTAINKYKVGYLEFLDNNLIGSNRERLDDLLSKLKTFFLDSADDYTLFTEIIPYRLDAALYKKIAIAGFRMAQLGAESLSDSLIRKMNKMNSFSDNLLGYKCCLKYGIKPDGANIITGIPDETEDDVKECTVNAHFLRFYIGGQLVTFNESHFALQKLSHYYKEMDEAERENYTEHFIYNLLPAEMTKGMSRFELFFFQKKNPPHSKLWKNFFEMIDYYKKAHFSYKIFSIDNLKVYEEFRNRIKISSLVFDNDEQWEILLIANDRLCSFNEMHEQLISKFANITQSKLKKMLKELKSHYLIYYDEDYNRIVSVIDTDNVV